MAFHNHSNLIQQHLINILDSYLLFNSTSPLKHNLLRIVVAFDVVQHSILLVIIIIQSQPLFPYQLLNLSKQLLGFNILDLSVVKSYDVAFSMSEVHCVLFYLTH